MNWLMASVSVLFEVIFLFLLCVLVGSTCESLYNSTYTESPYAISAGEE